MPLLGVGAHGTERPIGCGMWLGMEGAYTDFSVYGLLKSLLLNISERT